MAADLDKCFTSPASFWYQVWFIVHINQEIC